MPASDIPFYSGHLAPAGAQQQSDIYKTFHSEASGRGVEEEREGTGLVAAGEGATSYKKKKETERNSETQDHTVSPSQSPATWMCKGLGTYNPHPTTLCSLDTVPRARQFSSEGMCPPTSVLGCERSRKGAHTIPVCASERIMSKKDPKDSGKVK